MIQRKQPPQVLNMAEAEVLIVAPADTVHIEARGADTPSSPACCNNDIRCKIETDQMRTPYKFQFLSTSEDVLEKNEKMNKKDYETYPWLAGFEKECYSSVSNKNMERLEHLIANYLRNITPCVVECYRKPSKASRLRKFIHRALVWFNTFYANIHDPVEYPSYLDSMSELLSMYIDMELKSSILLQDNFINVAHRLTYSLFLYLQYSEDHVIDSILRSKLMTNKYKQISNPLMEKVLNRLSYAALDEIQYVRFLLAHKVWQNIKGSTEAKRRVENIAISRLIPPLKIMNKGMFDVILPMLPKKHTNITKYYMETDIDLVYSCESFLNTFSHSDRTTDMNLDKALSNPLLGLGKDADSATILNHMWCSSYSIQIENKPTHQALRKLAANKRKAKEDISHEVLKRMCLLNDTEPVPDSVSSMDAVCNAPSTNNSPILSPPAIAPIAPPDLQTDRADKEKGETQKTNNTSVDFQIVVNMQSTPSERIVLNYKVHQTPSSSLKEVTESPDSQTAVKRLVALAPHLDKTPSSNIILDSDSHLTHTFAVNGTNQRREDIKGLASKSSINYVPPITCTSITQGSEELFPCPSTSSEAIGATSDKVISKVDGNPYITRIEKTPELTMPLSSSISECKSDLPIVNDNLEKNNEQENKKLNAVSLISQAQQISMQTISLSSIAPGCKVTSTHPLIGNEVLDEMSNQTISNFNNIPQISQAEETPVHITLLSSIPPECQVFSIYPSIVNEVLEETSGQTISKLDATSQIPRAEDISIQNMPLINIAPTYGVVSSHSFRANETLGKTYNHQISNLDTISLIPQSPVHITLLGNVISNWQNPSKCKLAANKVLEETNSKTIKKLDITAQLPETEEATMEIEQGCTLSHPLEVNETSEETNDKVINMLDVIPLSPRLGNLVSETTPPSTNILEGDSLSTLHTERQVNDTASSHGAERLNSVVQASCVQNSTVPTATSNITLDPEMSFTSQSMANFENKSQTPNNSDAIPQTCHTEMNSLLDSTCSSMAQRNETISTFSNQTSGESSSLGTKRSDAIAQVLCAETNAGVATTCNNGTERFMANKDHNEDSTERFMANKDHKEDSTERFMANEDHNEDSTERFMANEDHNEDNTERFMANKDHNEDSTERFMANKDHSEDNTERFMANKDHNEDSNQMTIPMIKSTENSHLETAPCCNMVQQCEVHSTVVSVEETTVPNQQSSMQNTVPIHDSKNQINKEPNSEILNIVPTEATSGKDDISQSSLQVKSDAFLHCKVKLEYEPPNFPDCVSQQNGNYGDERHQDQLKFAASDYSQPHLNPNKNAHSRTPWSRSDETESGNGNRFVRIGERVPYGNLPSSMRSVHSPGNFMTKLYIQNAARQSHIAQNNYYKNIIPSTRERIFGVNTATMEQDDEEYPMPKLIPYNGEPEPFNRAYTQGMNINATTPGEINKTPFSSCIPITSQPSAHPPHEFQRSPSSTGHHSALSPPMVYERGLSQPLGANHKSNSELAVPRPNIQNILNGPNNFSSHTIPMINNPLRFHSQSPRLTPSPRRPYQSYNNAISYQGPYIPFANGMVNRQLFPGRFPSIPSARGGFHQANSDWIQRNNMGNRPYMAAMSGRPSSRQYVSPIAPRASPRSYYHNISRDNENIPAYAGLPRLQSCVRYNVPDTHQYTPSSVPGTQQHTGSAVLDTQQDTTSGVRSTSQTETPHIGQSTTKKNYLLEMPHTRIRNGGHELQQCGPPIGSSGQAGNPYPNYHLLQRHYNSRNKWAGMQTIPCTQNFTSATNDPNANPYNNIQSSNNSSTFNWTQGSTLPSARSSPHCTTPPLIPSGNGRSRGRGRGRGRGQRRGARARGRGWTQGRQQSQEVTTNSNNSSIHIPSMFSNSESRPQNNDESKQKPETMVNNNVPYTKMPNISSLHTAVYNEKRPLTTLASNNESMPHKTMPVGNNNMILNSICVNNNESTPHVAAKNNNNSLLCNTHLTGNSWPHTIIARKEDIGNTDKIPYNSENSQEIAKIISKSTGETVATISTVCQNNLSRLPTVDASGNFIREKPPRVLKLPNSNKNRPLSLTESENSARALFPRMLDVYNNTTSRPVPEAVAENSAKKVISPPYLRVPPRSLLPTIMEVYGSNDARAQTATTTVTNTAERIQSSHTVSTNNKSKAQANKNTTEIVSSPMTGPSSNTNGAHTSEVLGRKTTEPDSTQSLLSDQDKSAVDLSAQYFSNSVNKTSRRKKAEPKKRNVRVKW